MTETTMRQKLMKAHNTSDCRIVRIENSAEIGTPDLYYRHKCGSGWIELKFVHKPKEGSTVTVNFRPGQLQWILRETYLGGKVLLLTVDQFSLWRSFKGSRINYKYSYDEFCGENGIWYQVSDIPGRLTLP